jgi:glycosyltransferase involved in cell wall biosynthesis
MQIIFDARVIQDHFPGIGRYTYNLLAELPASLQAGEELVILHDPQAMNSHYDLARLAAPNARLVEYRMPIFTPRNLARAPRIEGSRPDRVHHFPYYLRPYSLRRSTITTIYDLITFVYPQLVPSPLTRLSIRLFNALAVLSSQAIITLSRSAAQDLAHFLPVARNKLTVIHGAPDAQFTPQPPDRCAAMRAKYNLPGPYVLCFGSNKPHKNLARLTEAWQEVSSNLAISNSSTNQAGSSITNDPLPLTLVIAGHQAESPQNLPGARYLGDVPNEDVAPLYSACELFVFPSLYEGFGLPPMEAMACGAPVACSNTSSLPEVVGDAALTFDPLDTGAIAAAMRQALASPDLRADLRQRSLRRAAQFTWSAAARQTSDLYRQVAPRPIHT